MNIKELIDAKLSMLTLDEAAAFFGVSKGTIANWKSGKTNINIDAVQKVLDECQPIEDASKLMPEPDGCFLPTDEPMMWKDKNCIILLPSYKTTNPLTTFCVAALMNRYPGKIGLDMEVRTMIHKARNVLLTRFMRISHKPEWALFIDDDMVLPVGLAAFTNVRAQANMPEKYAALDAIGQLVKRGKTVIGGLYFGRGKGAPAMYAEALNESNRDIMTRENRDARLAPNDTLKKTAGVATGCMLIHRSAVEAIEQKFPDIISENPNMPNGYFTPRDHIEGEDMAFCRRAREAGHQPYVDFSVVCGHVGTRIYWPNNITS
jgi:hypothetical protein